MASAGGGKVTSLTVNPEFPGGIYIGDTVGFSITYDANGDLFKGSHWYYTCTDCVPQDRVDWQNTNGSVVASEEEMLGTFKVDVVATFHDFNAQVDYTDTASITITVLPPDTAVISNKQDVINVKTPPINIPPAIRPNLAVKIQFTGNGRTLYFTAEPLEKVIHSVYPPTIYADYPWNTALYLNQTGYGEWTDYKGISGGQGWKDLPLGRVDEFDQSLGVRIANGCGGTTDIHVGPTFHFRQDKVDLDNWVLLLF